MQRVADPRTKNLAGIRDADLIPQSSWWKMVAANDALVLSPVFVTTWCSLKRQKCDHSFLYGDVVKITVCSRDVKVWITVSSDLALDPCGEWFYSGIIWAAVCGTGHAFTDRARILCYDCRSPEMEPRIIQLDGRCNLQFRVRAFDAICILIELYT